MYIGFIVTGDPESVTGGNLYNTYLINHLKEAGHKVDLVVIPQRNYVSNLWQNIAASNMDAHSFRKFDMILEDALAHPALLSTNSRLTKISLPVIAVIHAFRSVMKRQSVFKRIYSRVESRFLNSVDGIIYNSLFSKEEGDKNLLNNKPSVVAYPGRDRFSFHQSSGKKRKTGSGLHLIFVGNVHKGKGVHTLISALQKLGNENVTLDVVGSLQFDHRYVKRLRSEIRQFRLENQITFHGLQTEVELAQHFREADVLVVPSDSESFGMVYLEGFAFGLPAFASDVGGAREIVSHGHNGFLISPGDENALADHISQICTDYDLLSAMSSKAKDTYQNHPTWNESMEKIHQFLLGMVTNEQ